MHNSRVARRRLSYKQYSTRCDRTTGNGIVNKAADERAGELSESVIRSLKSCEL